MSDEVRVHGVLVTFRRHTSLSTTLDRLRGQTRPPDRLLVVDNGSDPEVRATVERQIAAGLSAEYVDAGDNLGPAGGYAIGMEMILLDAGEEDWIFLFDDDDPPFFDDAIAKALDFGREMVRRDPSTCGVGISGGRFDLRRGRVIRISDDQIQGPVPVDHITGGGLPAYRVAAVRNVGTPLRSLFFGFEELEYGLRLIRHGFTLYADGERWATRKKVKRGAGLLPPEEVSANRAARTRVTIAEPSWRRYYSLRNLIYILRLAGADGTAIRIAITRGLLKPLLNLPIAPRRAWNSLGSNWRAIRDGWRGRLGRTLSPEIEPETKLF
jgi:glycosyltransferase involved in cell wall biosynthesis